MHKHKGLLVLDSIAGGNLWVHLDTVHVDVLITAPQKGWCGPAFAGFVLMNDDAHARMLETKSNSYTVDLRKWAEVMEKYESGAFM